MFQLETKLAPANNQIQQNPNFQNANDGMRPVSSMSSVEIKREKFRIWKNVAVISLSFMCLFTAYNSVANLQVCINVLSFQLLNLIGGETA